MEPTTATLIGYIAAVVLMIVLGVYAIAAAPARYNGARSDAPRYRDGWNMPERVASVVLVAAFAVVLIPVLLLVEVMKSGK